jgi:dolichol-phosphate mannosyltransferase
MDSNRNELTFSFVCPVFNEQDGLETFYGRLKAVADKLGEAYEIVFVNDGSRDNSAVVLEGLVRRDDHVKVVEFSRNFGHQWAVTAGYDFAAGKCVISLDSDCQHPPEMIPELVARWREGYEVVYTVRKDTKGISPIRRALGRLMYRMIRKSSGLELTDQADFRLLDRRAVDAVRSMREQARFVRGLVNWVGFKQCSLPYTAERRVAGRSQYTVRQLMGMSTAGIFNFSTKPLRLAGWLGMLFMAAAVCYVPLAVAMWWLGRPLDGWMHLTCAMLAMMGLQFLVIGILGVYVGRIFEEAKDRPLYVVRRTMGFQHPGDDDRHDDEDEPRRGEKHPRFAVYT